MSDYVQINNHHSTAPANYAAKQNSTGTGSGFDDVLKAQEDRGAKTADTKSESAKDTDYREQLQEHMAQMLDNIRHGTIQPKIKIGAQEYTQEEWRKLLEKFDEAEEELIEQIEEDIQARIEQCEEERAMMEALAKSEMIKETEKAVDSPA